MNTLRITNGRVIDPSQGFDQVTDLWIRDGRIVGIGPQPQLQADMILDAAGKIVCPGLIDMHVHLREPGREEDETIATGTAAALAGGVTSVACMPNTEPALDSQAAAEFVYLQAERAGNANVFPVGAITKGRQGRGAGRDRRPGRRRRGRLHRRRLAGGQRRDHAPGPRILPHVRQGRAQPLPRTSS